MRILFFWKIRTYADVFYVSVSVSSSQMPSTDKNLMDIYRNFWLFFCFITRIGYPTLISHWSAFPRRCISLRMHSSPLLTRAVTKAASAQSLNQAVQRVSSNQAVMKTAVWRAGDVDEARRETLTADLWSDLETTGTNFGDAGACGGKIHQHAQFCI